MTTYFQDLVDPVFTPPWNRCSQTTITCLIEAGFKALSRDHRAAPLQTGPLVEIPVSVDWLKRSKGQR